MRMDPGWRRIRSALTLVVLAAALSITLAACGSDDKSSSSTTASSTPAAPATADTGASTTAAAEASKCGAGTGEKATGAPIKIGAIVTKQPGTDFTDGSNMAKAYFDCLNDNGGINVY